jgi:hypothetical protein
MSTVGLDGMWDLNGFVLVSVLQKLGAIAYYVTVTQAASRLGEQIWYLRGPWIARYSADDGGV